MNTISNILKYMDKQGNDLFLGSIPKNGIMENIEQTANKLIDALIDGDTKALNSLFSEDCKVHLPFKLNYSIDLEGKKEVLSYFQENFNCPTKEKIKKRKSVVSDKSHVLINFEGHSCLNLREEEFDSVIFCEIINEKITELYAIRPTLKIDIKGYW